MKRKIYTKLVEWKNQECHKPLILNGVRQCGKTYILKEFGLKEFDNLAYASGFPRSAWRGIIAYRSKVFSIYGVSILGACFHNIGQVIAITWIYQQYFMQLFLPILLALSIVSGILIAVVCKKVLSRIHGGFYGKI